MGRGTQAVLEPQVHMSAMAAIVHEIVTGTEDRRQDGRWLRERMTAAGLDTQECEALEALRMRVCQERTAEHDSDDGPHTYWN